MAIDPIKSFESLLNIRDRFAKIREAKEQTEAERKRQVHLLRLECRINLDILDSLQLNDAKQDASAFRQVALLLEISMLEKVFSDGLDVSASKKPEDSLWIKMKSGYRDLIKSEDDDDTDDNGLSQEPTLLEACEFVYRKITVLKQLVMLSEIEGRKEIHFRTRLKNIQEQLLLILKALHS